MAEEDSIDSARSFARLSPTYLIADSRERAVIPFLEDAFKHHALLVKQVTTADYLICRRGPAGSSAAVLAAIERKTLDDFAASFKDARYENVNKMRALREKTGCQLFFFVEGPAFPSPSRRFARIPYANILAAITKLMVRDGVFVVQTEDEAHTAKRLAELTHAFDSVGAVAAVAPAYFGGAGGAANAGVADVAADAGGVADVATEVAADVAAVDDYQFDVPAVLTDRTEPTECETAISMWMQLRGISVVLGKILTREFSVAELAAQLVPIDRISNLKTATGRKINKDALASLLAVRSGNLEQFAKVLAGIRNVTPDVARLILNSVGGVAALCAATVDRVAAIEIPQKNRTVRLGAARAKKVCHMLHWRETKNDITRGVAPPAATPAATLAAPPAENARGRVRAGEARAGAAHAGAARAEESAEAARAGAAHAEAPSAALTNSELDEILQLAGFA